MPYLSLGLKRSKLPMLTHPWEVLTSHFAVTFPLFFLCILYWYIVTILVRYWHLDCEILQHLGDLANFLILILKTIKFWDWKLIFDHIYRMNFRICLYTVIFSWKTKSVLNPISKFEKVKNSQVDLWKYGMYVLIFHLM